MKIRKGTAGSLIIRQISLILCFVLAMSNLTAVQADAAVALDDTHYLTPYQVTNYIIYDNDELKSFSMMGVDYYQGVLGKDTSSEKIALYNLDGDFTSVSFVVGHLDNGYKNASVLNVYSDNELVKEISLTADMVAQKVTIDTRNVRQLKFSGTTGWGRYGIANVIGEGGHVYESEVTKIATAKQSGIRTYTCKYCEHEYTETIDARVACTPALQPYQRTKVSLYANDEKSYFSVMGKRYYDGLVGDDTSAAKEALFNLSQNYSEVTFTVGHLDNAYRNSETLYVYSDGVQQKEIALTGEMINETVTVNTEGVTQLKITLGSTWGRYAIFDINYETDIKPEHSFEQKVDEAGGFITYTCTKCGAYYIETVAPGEPDDSPSGTKPDDNPSGTGPDDNPSGTGPDDNPSGTPDSASLTLSTSVATLYTGSVSNSVQITADISGPSQLITWQSSDTTVADVSSDGTITAAAKGTAVITATANGVSKTVTVTVKNPQITVKKSGKNTSSVTVKKKGSVQLSVAVKPAKSGISLQPLTAKQKKIASAKLSGSKLTIVGKKKGSFNIKLKSGQASKTVKITVQK